MIHTKAQKTEKTPLAIVISDVHYSLNTLSLADNVFNQATLKASQLGIPLICTGDLLDGKAIIRAEVANALISTLEHACAQGIGVYVIVGNHDLIHEKGSSHALNFLRPYCTVVDEPLYGRFNFIPYQNNPQNFLAALHSFPKGSIVFGHQGTKGGFMGDYVMDPSAFDPKEAEGYKVYLGHYHDHYENGPTVSIGNPYSLSFGEANTHPKGFLIIYTDGSCEHVPTNLRRHVIVERTVETVMDPIPNLNSNDLLWLKVTGPYSEVERLQKREIGLKHLGHASFKLDKIPTETERQAQPEQPKTGEQMLDAIIEGSGESQGQQTYLKKTWREIV